MESWCGIFVHPDGSILVLYVDYFLVVDSGSARIVSWAWRAPVIGTQVDETACRRALADRDAAN